jgi:hypothetical protein
MTMIHSLLHEEHSKKNAEAVVARKESMWKKYSEQECVAGPQEKSVGSRKHRLNERVEMKTEGYQKYLPDSWLRNRVR